MLRVRLKADGRIVEVLPDGSERSMGASDCVPLAMRPANGTQSASGRLLDAAYARNVRGQTGLTQTAFAARIGVPVETVRNWEQGKRSPRGPARALLKVIDQAPDAAFAVLGGTAALSTISSTHVAGLPRQQPELLNRELPMKKLSFALMLASRRSAVTSGSCR